MRELEIVGENYIIYAKVCKFLLLFYAQMARRIVTKFGPEVRDTLDNTWATFYERVTPGAAASIVITSIYT